MSTESMYQSPFSDRYASQEMLSLFSATAKHTHWRQLWVALAEAERELGLPISHEQIDELKKNKDQINYSAANTYEKQFSHDVMAHIHAYGDLCPLAKPIIHLGATSCYVTDNTDIMQMRQGLILLKTKLLTVINQLADFAKQYAALPTLGFTHLQPAQLTTVGKRAALWLQDFVLDLEEMDYRLQKLSFRGVKGTTGTQASFLTLFQGDHEKVKKLDQLIAEKMGFDHVIPISGQTYTRKQDVFILNTLAGIAISAHKFGTDLRLLAFMKEVEEPFEKKQIGSSAMPYKRNPILSERICSLARFLISLSENPAYTAATQWMERTLDDSANRRISISESFLCADAILELLIKVTHKLVVNPKMILQHITNELPFIATENILMAAAIQGGDRQELHEKLRQHSMQAAEEIKCEGKDNDLLERINNDPSFKLNEEQIQQILDPASYIGRAPEQVEEYLASINNHLRSQS